MRTPDRVDTTAATTTITATGIDTTDSTAETMQINSNKVHNNVTTAADWIRDANSFMDMYEKKGELPKHYKLGTRVVGTCLCPLYCGCCCAWSLLARILCCPFTTVQKGCAFCCSDNACSKPTDYCVEHYVAEMYRNRTLSAIPIEFSGLTAADVCAARQFVRRVRAVFFVPGTKQLRPCNSAMYKLTDCLFAASFSKSQCLPIHIDIIMEMIESKLNDAEEKSQLISPPA